MQTERIGTPTMPRMSLVGGRTGPWQPTLLALGVTSDHSVVPLEPCLRHHALQRAPAHWRGLLHHLLLLVRRGVRVARVYNLVILLLGMVGGLIDAKSATGLWL